MIIFFEIAKTIFLIASIVVGTTGIISISGSGSNLAQQAEYLLKLILPLYLVFSGIVISYIFAKMIATYQGSSNPSKTTLIKTMIIGIFIGVGCAFMYGMQNNIFL